MCTVVLLHRPGHDWPVLIAANRDEMAGRPWQPPARHWTDRPEVVAGLDVLAGGSWLGLNDHGVVAAMLNRVGSLGPAPGKRSRGELVLEALDHADAAAAADALAFLDPAAYRPFNMLLADSEGAFWVRSLGEASHKIDITIVAPGLHMLTAHDLDDPQSARILHHKPRFEAATAPNPDTGDWQDWQALMASTEHEESAGPRGAMTIHGEGGFGTVSASLIALPRPRIEKTGRPVWLFSAGAPDTAAFAPVVLE
ncbi:MAG: NRDE family protein [Alphaproteobacteria bacterium]|nr:NRDE family protein [Alphaproteobacteria bacterium]